MTEVDTAGEATVVGPGNDQSYTRDQKLDGTKPMAVRAAERRLSELYLLIRQAQATARLEELYQDEYDEIKEFIGFYESTGVDL